MKRRMDMKMAGVADPTVTRESRRVFTLKASPQPGMKIGVCKSFHNHMVTNVNCKP